ncbi:MAG: alpha-hydroxy-acid oxidizing protein, partial [Pedobacter sp.]
MNLDYNQAYPGIDDLRNKAKSKIPRFAFEYLDGGCNEDINLYRNTSELREIQLKPRYLEGYQGVDMSTTLFGKTYAAPFGVAPVGLQGLIWPNSPNILAKAAHEHNVPFILSTVTTSAIEDIAKITNGDFWYQLYHPAEDRLRDDIIKRLKEVECDVLVILADVPSFGFRPRDIRNGLAMPPRMTL